MAFISNYMAWLGANVPLSNVTTTSGCPSFWSLEIKVAILPQQEEHFATKNLKKVLEVDSSASEMAKCNSYR